LEKENKVLEEVVNRKFSKIKGRCDLRKLSSVLLEQRLLHGYLGWGVSWPHTRVPTCSTRDGGCREWSVGLPDQAGESPEGNPPKGNFMLNSEKMRKKKYACYDFTLRTETETMKINLHSVLLNMLSVIIRTMQKFL